MTLKEVLTGLADSNNTLLLKNSDGFYTPSCLLDTLSETKLKTQAHYQPGLYIAEINEAGYLGAVLFEVKREK